MSKPKNHRISVDLNDSTYKHLKMMCLYENKTITAFINTLVEEKAKSFKNDDDDVFKGMITMTS